MSVAHTAEHVFMGSLKKLMPNIEVKKVETQGEKGSVWVSCKNLNWQVIFEAEKMTNKIIDEAKVIKEHFFESLDDARKAFPSLRAYDERILGKTRVIEVDGYDYSACKAEHAKNTKECSFFIVTKFSKVKKDFFEIEFHVGESAKLKALEIAKICMEVSEIVGATLDTLKNTIRNLRDDLLDLRKRFAQLSKKEAEDIKFIEKNGIKIYFKIFEGLDNKKLMERIGELIKNRKSIALFANKNDSAFLILGRSSDLGLDCNAILKEVFMKFNGKGGGKPEFASGIIDKDKIDEAFELIKSKIWNL
ncbi:MAG: DHHA1 domain-containing protein [Nitrososphaerales archaeon]